MVQTKEMILVVYLSADLIPHLILQSFCLLLVVYDFLLKRYQLLHLGLVELVLLSRFFLQFLKLLLKFFVMNEQTHFQVLFSTMYIHCKILHYLFLSDQQVALVHLSLSEVLHSMLIPVHKTIHYCSAHFPNNTCVLVTMVQYQ